MNLKDIREALLDFWKEFRRVKYGIIGLIAFTFFLLIVVFEPVIIPFAETNTRWRDITYWEDNPKNAKPVWTNWFTSKDSTPQAFLRKPKMEVIPGEEDTTHYVITFPYEYKYEIAPLDLALRMQGLGNINLNVTLQRPDGKEITLSERTVMSTTMKDIKLSLEKEASSKAVEFASQYVQASDLRNSFALKSLNILFAQTGSNMVRDPQALKGDYKVKIDALVIGEGEIKEPYLVVAGKIFGVLGTDSSKRDLWSGVIAGTKWAMLIGLMTAFVSVVIGIIYGVTSAYFGGWVDSLLMRIYEVFLSMPLLPILIVVGAVFKPSIWTMIILMCSFFWVGSVRTVRSMALQIKEETYVEAAHALNASHARIIFRHMIPQLVPFAFASMALQVPGAIIYEATVSLIGLGDATIVTWGQILQDAIAGGAMLQGLWWWVVPPGMFLALMGMTFAFIGFAMDTILNPKLRTR